MIDRVLSFFLDNFPTTKEMLIGGPAGLVWAYTCLFFAGFLKQRRGFRTGYSRKTFHFLIFGSVCGIQAIWGTSGVCLFGGMTSVVIFYAVLRGSGNMLYEAMAREKDQPHRTHYIVVPYFATLIGGLASNILFGPVAVVGYLVTGLGDAVGEPVGVKYGKHQYRVPSLKSVKAVRSWEGSAAVFAGSLLSIFAAIGLSAELEYTTLCLLTVPLVAAAAALAEAVSPHGWDNATMQIVPTFLACLLL